MPAVRTAKSLFCVGCQGVITHSNVKDSNEGCEFKRRSETPSKRPFYSGIIASQ